MAAKRKLVVMNPLKVVITNYIPNDKMKELLKEIGLVKGQVYQRSSLELLKKNLKQAYNARGKYNAQIKSSVISLTENRVAITVTISEGRVTRIKDIKVFGNHDFSEHELLSHLSLTTSNFLTYFTKKDQYSKAAMDASLESLRSFYLNRGYLKFKIVSSQVLLAPDRKDVYINIYINEGPQYRFSGYEIQGKTIISKENLAPLIQITPGKIFSSALLKITQLSR
jgi:outer membrane protein insertion porin family